MVYFCIVIGKIVFGWKLYILDPCISQLQAGMWYCPDGAHLVIWEHIKLSGILWISLSDNKSNLQHSNATSCLISSWLAEAKGCIFKYALGAEIDITCYEITCTDIINGVTWGGKVCSYSLEQTMVHTLKKWFVSK